MENFPEYLILPDKVYALSVDRPIEEGRAFERRLIDYAITLTNPTDNSDYHSILLGMNKLLYETYREAIPIEWLLSRFLVDYIRSDTLYLLGDVDGHVLDQTNYENYLGQKIISNTQADKQLWTILDSWIRVFPKKEISWLDIYVSVTITKSILDRSINSFIHRDRMRETMKGVYEISHKILNDKIKIGSPPK
ncbi:MAG: hypothetical protein KKH04_05940 [Proteobacteria bacterium]|nr:hypothetical protein [Pseudomonadota bacterium]